MGETRVKPGNKWGKGEIMSVQGPISRRKDNKNRRIWRKEKGKGSLDFERLWVPNVNNVYGRVLRIGL